MGGVEQGLGICPGPSDSDWGVVGGVGGQDLRCKNVWASPSPDAQSHCIDTMFCPFEFFALIYTH